MKLADINLMAFTLCNSFRVVARPPQILKAATHASGGRAISFAIFLANATGCAVIFVVAAWRRSLCRETSHYATALR
jgi:hypothetical protein